MWWMIAAASVLPVGALGQANDVGYCLALSQKYLAYVGDMSTSRSSSPGSVDAQVAMEQCKTGNTAAAIPVLEKKLRDARIDLPPRG
jgi:hypothetical protein